MRYFETTGLGGLRWTCEKTIDQLCETEYVKSNLDGCSAQLWVSSTDWMCPALD